MKYKAEQFLRSFFHNSKEIRWFPSGNKPEETEVLCTMKKFQDGRSFPLEQGSRKKYYLQTGPQGWLFFSSSSQGLSNLLIGGGGGEVVPISLSVFRASFSHKNLYRALQSLLVPNISFQQVEYSDNSLPEWLHSHKKKW